MIVQTTRFGTLEIDDARIIDFPNGLLGFSSYRRFALLQPDDQSVFFWLQSLEAPDLAFVVTDPGLWVPDYAAQIRPEQSADLGLADPSDAQVLVIVNRRDEVLTANLQGPLLVNVRTCRGLQIVMAERRWNVRHELMKVGAAAPRLRATA
jgi:flagellar assembly factor FliW